jgi:hypothetical protein
MTVLSGLALHSSLGSLVPFCFVEASIQAYSKSVRGSLEAWDALPAAGIAAMGSIKAAKVSMGLFVRHTWVAWISLILASFSACFCACFCISSCRCCS